MTDTQGFEVIFLLRVLLGVITIIGIAILIRLYN